VPLAFDCGKFVIFTGELLHDSPAELVRVELLAKEVVQDIDVVYFGVPPLLFCGFGLILKVLI
jgi:hypothetical protein